MDAPRPKSERTILRAHASIADVPRRAFRRGAKHPKAVPWFGIRSFYGHLWHLVASAIATQDIDSRDWMHPDSPSGLTTSVARVLDPGAPNAESVTEALDRDLYVDYVADTGDDVEVSRAVATMVAAEYDLDDAGDGEPISLPRGDILLFGGDTAYPVATSTEIEARLLTPWNHVLAETNDGKRRVLLGIPGNHDWYDGLDGFARMFRARQGSLAEDRPTMAPGAERPVRHFVSWMEAFAMGKHLVKRRALPIIGYEPVQRASYFALALAPGVDLWGVDRQLRHINFQQRRFFWERRSAAPSQSLLLCLPDPLRAYLERSKSGTAMLNALNVDPARDPMLCIAGDTHHYERWSWQRSVHLVAGGGGAFLHGARMARGQKKVPAVEFPGPRASRALLARVPWRVATGGAGIIPHLLLAVSFAPALDVGLRSGARMDAVSVGGAIMASVICAVLAGLRRRTFVGVILLATVAGLLMAIVPTATHAGIDVLLGALGASASPKTAAVVVFVLSIFGGAWVFGLYLAALALFGLNHDQAFAALGHPGYKHFVRMRVRKDGSRVDAWVIGLVDPLGNATPVLVDRTTFRPSPPVHGHESMLPASQSSS